METEYQIVFNVLTTVVLVMILEYVQAVKETTEKDQTVPVKVDFSVMIEYLIVLLVQMLVLHVITAELVQDVKELTDKEEPALASMVGTVTI